MIFSLFFVSNNSKVITSLAKVFYGDNEITLDNWEISTVFYDSTVNDGQTPLTEINWDASDGGYGTGETRIITVQINYKNSNVVIDYASGSLQIDVPNITKDYTNMKIDTTIVVSANDDTHTGFDWDFKSKKIDLPEKNKKCLKRF